MSNWLSHRWTSSQSVCRFFRVVVISHCLAMHSMVSACLRARFEENLRLFIKYSSMIRIFLHVLKELDTVLNLRFNVVKLPWLRSMLGSPLVVMISISELVFVLNPTYITAIVVLGSLNSISNYFAFHFPFRRRLGHILMFVVFKRSLLEAWSALTSLSRRTVGHSTGSMPTSSAQFIFHLVFIPIISLLLVRTSAQRWVRVNSRLHRFCHMGMTGKSILRMVSVNSPVSVI